MSAPGKWLRGDVIIPRGLWLMYVANTVLLIFTGVRLIVGDVG